MRLVAGSSDRPGVRARPLSCSESASEFKASANIFKRLATGLYRAHAQHEQSRQAFAHSLDSLPGPQLFNRRIHSFVHILKDVSARVELDRKAPQCSAG